MEKEAKESRPRKSNDSFSGGSGTGKSGGLQLLNLRDDRYLMPTDQATPHHRLVTQLSPQAMVGHGETRDP
jgi:hypothetical protein